MTSAPPSRADIWLVNLDPTRGHEQGGTRPGLVVSVDPFNHGPAGLVILLPVTKVDKGIPFHVPVLPPEGGLKERSFIKCEDIRSVSTGRLNSYWGAVSSRTMAAVEERMRVLLDL